MNGRKDTIKKMTRFRKINVLFISIIVFTIVYNFICLIFIEGLPFSEAFINTKIVGLFPFTILFLVGFFTPPTRILKLLQFLVVLCIGFTKIPFNAPDNFTGHVVIMLAVFLAQKYGFLKTHITIKAVVICTLLLISIALSYIIHGRSFSLLLGPFAFIAFFYGLLYIIFEEDIQKLLRKVEENKPLISLGRNVSMVVHNLKNSISTIDNQITFMEEGMVPNGEAGYGVLHRYTDELYERLARLTYSITVNDSVHEDIIDLSMIAGSVVETLNLDKDIKNRVTIYTAFHRGVRIIAVPIDVKEIIENVLINAVEAMPPDRKEKGIITLSIRNDDEQGIAIIEITDNGAGIPGWTRADNARESSLFSYRFHMCRSSKPEGTGQGMIYIMQTLHKYRGDIKITSYKGKGTTVRMMIPIVTDSGTLHSGEDPTKGPYSENTDAKH
jgi:signal transduction histidine kinase